MSPPTPSPPVTAKAPEVEETALVLERIDTDPTKVDVFCTLRPVPIFTFPETPNPPTTCKAPDVEDVEFVFERTATEPTKVDVPWTDIPEAAKIVLVTLSPVPMFILPETPNPPTIFKAPEVDEVVFVLERIETAPTKVDVLCTLRHEPILAEPDMLNPVPPIISPLTPKPPL
jgi:hypothetical protein